MERTKWLDGLRGIAAAIVAADHFFMSDVWHPFVSYWTDPPEGNRHIVQLPPIRILFSAHGMVTLFMVISGYAISISLLNARSGPQFLARVSSAVVRRVLRIYMPVFVTASLAQIFYFFDLYHWPFDEGFLETLPKPWTAPWDHFTWVLNYMADSINIIAFEYRGALNGQLWTMPVEFRGSNVVYLLIVGLSGWRAKSRFYVLPLLACFFLWYGNWDIFGFIWGLWLAERARSRVSTTTPSLPSDEPLNSEFEMAEFEDEDRSRSFFTAPLRLGSWRGKLRCKSPKSRECITLSRISAVLIFIAGYYLLCLGNDGHLPPGYQFLSVLQPSRWKDKWDIYHFCWKTIGSAMLVYAIGELPCLQRPLDSRVVQYLGKISFALYLLHETIYELFRNPLRDLIYSVLSGKEYESSGVALGNDPLSFHAAWWSTGVLLGAVVVGASHFYTIYVDDWCVAFAKKVDRWLSY
jgi:peptidoglycan/LPS O-acetylase OafA/YrhL